jgi:hypothetical protein
MQYTYNRLLTESELREHLRARHRVVLRIPGIEWHKIEREVERLGFGESFLVSSTNGKRGESCRIGPCAFSPRQA